MAHRLHEYREGGYSTSASSWCSNRYAALNHCQTFLCRGQVSASGLTSPKPLLEGSCLMDLTRGLPFQPARMFQDQLYAGLAQVPSSGQAAPDDFNKMFPNLAPFAGCTPAAIARVRE